LTDRFSFLSDYQNWF